jgi:hypothetical protein
MLEGRQAERETWSEIKSMFYLAPKPNNALMHGINNTEKITNCYVFYSPDCNI